MDMRELHPRDPPWVARNVPPGSRMHRVIKIPGRTHKKVRKNRALFQKKVYDGRNPFLVESHYTIEMPRSELEEVALRITGVTEATVTISGTIRYCGLLETECLTERRDSITSCKNCPAYMWAQRYLGNPRYGRPHM